MGYIQLPKNEIRISIPILIQNNTSIAREAYLSNMNYDRDGERVILNWVVQHFSILENNEKGDYLGAIIPDYIRKLEANNLTMCDASTGIPIEPDQDGTYDSQTINYTGQYDFFSYLAENQEIIVNQFIRNFGMLVQDWSKK